MTRLFYPLIIATAAALISGCKPTPDAVHQFHAARGIDQVSTCTDDKDGKYQCMLQYSARDCVVPPGGVPRGAYCENGKTILATGVIPPEATTWTITSGAGPSK